MSTNRVAVSAEDVDTAVRLSVSALSQPLPAGAARAEAAWWGGGRGRAGEVPFAWDPPADLCDRVLARLFRDVPADTDRWQVLLWATGRAELPGRPRLTSWRWYG
jgi:hypothetical protein